MVGVSLIKYQPFTYHRTADLWLHRNASLVIILIVHQLWIIPFAILNHKTREAQMNDNTFETLSWTSPRRGTMALRAHVTFP